jgi:HD-GYP domain-containing protein (c-di-GMP phosphodiesterase class II)
LAGIFHDVGKKELDQELLSKPRFLLSHAEQREIENHVIRGQEILRQIKTIHSDVVRMVLEHHEDVAGLGYPFRKKRKDQHPLSRILQSVNILSETIIDMRRDAGDINVETLFSEIENQYQNRIDDECLVGLKKLFKVEERRTKLAS